MSGQLSSIKMDVLKAGQRLEESLFVFLLLLDFQVSKNRSKKTH